MRLAVFAFALSVVACAGGPTPDLVVVLNAPGRDGYTLLVYDKSGLVVDAKSSPRLAQDPTDAVLAFPERNELYVSWTGGACAHKPTLEVTGSSSDMLLSVGNPSDPNWLPFLPIECPAVGIPLNVTITFSEPVEIDAVGLAVSY